MTLPASGAISISAVNVECSAASTTQTPLSWIQTNSRYAYKDLNSLHSLAWFTAVSSQNSASITPGGLATNCVNSSSHQFTGGFDGAGSNNYTNCNIAYNCNQCGYVHGATSLQANCNCNCNCAGNCVYTNCNCNCNCTCG